MKKIFCAYADQSCAYSLKRIGNQAKSLGVFDDIRLYTPLDLPEYVKTLALLKHGYGGGYWAWKPFIIYETLKNEEDGAVVCYADAGCTLRKGVEWIQYFEIMKDYDTLCFKYRDSMPEWKKFGTSETAIRYWGKKSSLIFLDIYIGDKEWRNDNKIWGGLLFFRGKKNNMLKHWMNITKNHPEVILDPSPKEMTDQYPYFALHKHDQVVITALAHASVNCMILPELSETYVNGAVCATRYRCSTKKDFLVEKAKRLLKSFIGANLYDKIRRVSNEKKQLSVKV